MRLGMAYDIDPRLAEQEHKSHIRSKKNVRPPKIVLLRISYARSVPPAAERTNGDSNGGPSASPLRVAPFPLFSPPESFTLASGIRSPHEILNLM